MKPNKWHVNGYGILMFLLLQIPTTGHLCGQDKPTLPYVPEKVDTVLVTRPAMIMKSRDYRTLKHEGGEYLEKTVNRWTNSYFSISLAELNEIEMIIHASEVFPPDSREDRPQMINLLIIKTVEDNSEQFELATHDIVETLKHKNKEYFRTSKPIQRQYHFVLIADSKTLVCAATKHSMESAIDAGTEGASKARWFKTWQTIGKRPVSVVIENDAINTSGIFAYLEQQPSKETDGAREVEFMVLDAEPGQTCKLNCRMFFPRESNARDAAKFVEQGLEMAWNMLNLQGEALKEQGQEATFNIARDVLKSTKVTSQGKIVQLSSKVSIDFKALRPMIEQNYRSMVRMESAKNLRQVMLSMHNYASAKGHLPPPVLVSDAGKQYSWRIAVLPYIGEQELYDEYRFDEQWNSPHNSKVTSKMPGYFRSNPDDDESTNTSWFLLSGNEGIYGGKDPGSFANIRDGSSNTIIAVEAKRAVHWAEPVDINIDRKTGIPKLGGIHNGGFNAAFADGSVRFISEDVAPEILWQLYTASGGEIVQHNETDRDDD